MKKILIIILLLSLNCGVKALGTNGTTNGLELKPFNSSEECYTGYYWGGALNKPSTEGIRVSFYTLDGSKQLGKTIDVWTNDRLFNYDNEGKTYGRLKEKITQQAVTLVSGTPSRLDYVNGVSSKLVTDNYTYFIDKDYEGKTWSPLWYTKNGNSNQFKAYFTNPSIVKDYIKAADAKIDGVLIDASTSEEYIIILEPVIIANACKSQKPGYSGVYSSADFAKYIYSATANSININCEVPQTLRLTSEAKIGKYTFSAPSLKKCSSTGENYTVKDRATGTTGVGMFLVYGNEVCKENCITGNKYQIVYRNIDLSNPFLDINGNKRTLDPDSNWYNDQKSGNSVIDTKIYSKKPELTVTLTPTIIKSIRAYNKEHDYKSATDSTFKIFYSKFSSIFDSTKYIKEFL